jgi:hypothetical protein
METKGSKLDYSDITIRRKPEIFTFNIYRKTNWTNTIIHETLYHPTVHKAAACNYLYNKINTYPISENNKPNE